MRTRLLILGGTAVALVGLLAACGTTSTATGSGTSTSAAPPSSAEMMNSGAGSVDDVAFAQLMIPHHQQAIEMADLALAQGSSPDVLALATQIKGAQDPEIAMMGQWLSAWGAPMAMATDESGHDMGDMGDMGGMGGMMSSGMMSADEMSQLHAASGADFDPMWLRMMIAHHEGAIAMAKQVHATTTNPAVRDLARAVIDGQTAEIETMQGLLSP